MRDIFAKSGQIIRPGEQLFIPDLADTLSDLAKEGESFVRTGTLAQAILADQQANGGLLTATDLLTYQVRQCSPFASLTEAMRCFCRPQVLWGAS